MPTKGVKKGEFVTNYVCVGNVVRTTGLFRDFDFQYILSIQKELNLYEAAGTKLYFLKRIRFAINHKADESERVFSFRFNRHKKTSSVDVL